jgi:hypothetical protein
VIKNIRAEATSRGENVNLDWLGVDNAVGTMESEGRLMVTNDSRTTTTITVRSEHLSLLQVRCYVRLTMYIAEMDCFYPNRRGSLAYSLASYSKLQVHK